MRSSLSRVHVSSCLAPVLRALYRSATARKESDSSESYSDLGPIALLRPFGMYLSRISNQCSIVRWTFIWEIESFQWLKLYTWRNGRLLIPVGRCTSLAQWLFMGIGFERRHNMSDSI